MELNSLLPLSYAECTSFVADWSLERLLYTGFYPRLHDQNLIPTEALSFYVRTYVERDLRQLIAVKDLILFEKFLGLCAANVGQLLNLSRIGNDVGIDQKTVAAWLSVLEASYILYRLPPHFKNLRKRLVKSSKLYFYDVGLACYLLGISEPTQLEKHPLRGPLFENFVITEILKNRFNRAQTNNLHFYRDSANHEIDLILEEAQLITAVEIKSAQTFHPEFIKDLKYYAKLNPNVKEKWIFFSGSSSPDYQGVCVRSYRELAEL